MTKDNSELVKELRAWKPWDVMVATKVIEAADAIERLEAEREQMTNQPADNSELVAEARKMGSPEGWKFWDGHIPKLFTALADAIERLEARWVHFSNLSKQDHDGLRQRAEAAEQRCAELEDARIALKENVNEASK